MIAKVKPEAAGGEVQADRQTFTVELGEVIAVEDESKKALDGGKHFNYLTVTEIFQDVHVRSIVAAQGLHIDCCHGSSWFAWCRAHELLP